MFVNFTDYVKKYKEKVDVIVLDIDDGIENKIIETPSEDIMKFIKNNNLDNDTIGVKFITRYPNENFCTIYCYC